MFVHVKSAGDKAFLAFPKHTDLVKGCVPWKKIVLLIKTFVTLFAPIAAFAQMQKCISTERQVFYKLLSVVMNGVCFASALRTQMCFPW